MNMNDWPFSPVNTLYLVMSLLGFLAMLLDKAKSVKGKWRIPEKTLMGVALFGGALGMIAGMILFRHKIRKPLFYIGLPVIYLIHRIWVMPFLIQLLIDIGFVW